MKPGTTAYKNLHRNVGRLYGKPSKCETCDTPSVRYEWANITGVYEIDRENWKRLCVVCHRQLDAKSYLGNRFTGKKHTTLSKSKMAESMRKYWAKNREKMVAVQLRGEKHGRYKHGHYIKREEKV